MNQLPLKLLDNLLLDYSDMLSPRCPAAASIGMTVLQQVRQPRQILVVDIPLGRPPAGLRCGRPTLGISTRSAKRLFALCS